MSNPSSTTYTPKEIRAVADDCHFHPYGVTIVSGQSAALDVGTILGKITSSGKYTKYDPALTNGAEKAVAILAERVDATGSDDKNALAYCRGIFIEAQLGAELDDGAKVDLGAISRPCGLVLP